MNELGLYRLLAPYFLAGFTFPDAADAYLSKVGVTELTTTYDTSASVTTGTLVWGDAPRSHRPSTGRGGFAWEDVTVRFRLVVPRDGTPLVNTAVHAGATTELAALLDTLLPVDQTATTPTEYPGVRFRLELLLSELHFELGEDWRPGKLDADHRVVRDAAVDGPVRIVLPNAELTYEQADDFQSPPRLQIASWGSGGFDAPSTLTAGQVVRMEPPIAAHRSGRVGFGLGAVVVDFDPDTTPPEILQFFGTDESFTGLYVQSARFYYADEGKDLAVNAAVKDLLISFAGEVSFDASVDLIGPESTLRAALHVVDGGKDLPVAPGRMVPPSTVVTGGKVRASTAAAGTVEVVGGTPPVAVSLRAGSVDLLDAATGRVSFAALPPGTHTLRLEALDAATGADQRSYSEDIELTLVAPAAPAAVAGAPADRPARTGELPAIVVSNATGDATHSLTAAGNVGGTRERFRVLGPGTPAVTAGGTTVPVVDGFIEVDVPENTAGLVLSATWPAVTSEPQRFELRFTKGWPRESEFGVVLPKYLDDTVADSVYEDSRVPGQVERGTAAVRAWLATLGPSPSVSLEARASFETEEQRQADQLLSERRREVAVGAIGSAATVTAATATGQNVAHAAFLAGGPRSNPADRVATLTAVVSTAAATAGLTVSRGQRLPETPEPAPPTPERPPAPQPKQPPGVFRRAGIRVKVIRNEPVLLELTGQLDFETQLEKSLRNPSVPTLPAGTLELKQSPAAVSGPNTNPRDGVVDFRLTVVHDPATSSWTETLAIGAHPDDVDGLLQMTNPSDGELKNTLGSVLILAPILGTTAGALDPASAGSYVVLGGAVVGAAAVGAAGFVRTEKITLYGGELRLRQFIPPGDPARFTDAGVVFDYGVEFGVAVAALGISTTKPLKVRYRALGFNINFPAGAYQPIFDTSRGYELDLSDPGLFALPSPIDNVLKIFGARIARVNPVTVELDLGMKVDLGVVTVDRFKVKLPIDPPGPPTILPSGVRVDIAKVLLGSGYVNIVEPPAAVGEAEPGFGGIEGAFDVTLVPLKLRIAAAFGIRPVSKDGRNATAVFLGLTVDLPTPIPLAQSGIGIYGFSGLFAMHYKRIENDPNPNDAVGPAILWLQAAGGEPSRLVHNGVRLWDPELDRWSFGIGISLGSVDGGFLVNLRGMFVLELPGPRILIFVKILVIQPLPGLEPGNDLTVGILGVLDLDIPRKSVTIGIIVDLEIKEILSVVVPVELFAKLDQLDNWHLFVGTFSAPASARILDIVRGFGYLMIAGHDITGWPGYGTTRTLPGIAVAAGIGASLVLGDEGIGLYLKVSARADVGVSFSPRLFLAGRIQLDGELRLFIVSIGARGTLDVEAPDPLHLRGEVCGHVDFFFFSVEGCVTVEVGPDPPPPPPPALVRNVWLQSHAPVITAGQAGDRPIDASLGDALAVTQPPAAGGPPVVPIDAVPVIQFQTAPTTGSVTTFTEPLTTAPGIRTGGWVSLGGRRQVTYALTRLRLDGPVPTPGTPKATWRPDPATKPTGGRTNIDLALLSNVPQMGARAMERSTDLEAVIEGTWGDVCTPVAPPAAVLWTFCRQRLGPSGTGWDLTGHAWPDPPGTLRTEPVDLALHVGEPVVPLTGTDILLGHTTAGRIQPARVIGPNGPPPEPPEEPEPRRCVRLVDAVADRDPNPSLVAAAGRPAFRITVLDRSGVPFPVLRISGVGPLRGVDAGFRTEIEPSAPAVAISITVVRFNPEQLIVTAFDARGAIVDRARTGGPERTPEAVNLTGPGISRVVVEAPQDEAVLLEVCVPARPGRVPRAAPAVRVTAAAARADLDCMRALQVPELLVPAGKGDIELTAELDAAAQQRPDERWVELRTGPLLQARLYLAVARVLLTTDSVVVEQLDRAGAVVDTTALAGLAPVTVNGTAGLPATWTDPSGPWAAEVGSAAALLADPVLAGLITLWVTVTPEPDVVALRIRVRGTEQVRRQPAVVLAAAEVLTVAESDRHDTAESSRSGRADTLAGYLDGTSLVPLLAPATTYTLHVDYVPTTRDEQPDGSVTETTHPAVSESFRFVTDSAPPVRLDPYVLVTNPGHEEQFVFSGDTVQIVFNDLQIVQLFARYGRTLRAVLRAADGSATPAHQVGSLDEVPATVTSPLYDLLDAQVKAGAFPCVGPYHTEGHGHFEFPEPLRPSMAYMLDIETEPAPASTGEPVQPLFRRQFSTGRFASLTELVHEIQARTLDHVVLTGPLAGLGPDPVATDLALENALVAAGMPAPGAPRRGGQSVLWRPLPDGRYVPHALLIDASEPLWRTREEPRAEKVPGQPDDAFTRIVPGRAVALELAAGAGSPVTRFVRSPSGTRTLALLDDAAWPATGATVVVDAVRTSTTLYPSPAERVNVSTIPLGGRAPWEDDDG